MVMQTAIAMMTALALLVSQTLTADAQSAPASFADLADQVSPAVVNITTSTTVAGNTGAGPMIPEGSPFEEFFRDFMDQQQNGNRAPRRSSALGRHDDA